ncbi:SGNH/GDSL hydrolase family protein [uncultured Treponema sp.]|uniref:SGNH/GDSL hydrolase family protein n=1 Tax=uncultured Treponema sp. TaxID=162155 RepID=UPI0025EDA042|nr:SGNH/GDSL hydrolase family protein [uncultured Treponema sp.]
MKKLLAASLALFAGLSLSSFAQDAATAKLEKVEAVVAKDIQVPEGKKLSRIFIVGDSTASPFDDPYFIPRFGFGTKVQDYLNPKKAAVVNLAVSGRSSKNFITDAGSGKNYELLKSNIRKGDYLIIAFGHNDEKLEEERYTNPNGTKEEAGSFKNSLYENYVKLAQNAGATPVLVTPIVRLNKKAEYSGATIHITNGSSEFPGGDYPQAIRDLGAELKIVVVDQTENTKALYEKVGEEAKKYHAMTGSKESSLDTTHLNAYGASVVAKMLVEDLAKKDKNFKKLVQKAKEPVYDREALKNPSYVEPGFGAPAAKSSIFATTEPWWGSAFGNVGGASKPGDKNLNEIIEIANGVQMHSGMKDGSKDCGKIAASEDGILFYFQKLSIVSDFTLTAKAKILNIKSNNQVSFGLMARDNVLIDTSLGGFNSNYAAAGALKIANADSWAAGFARIDTVLNENPHSVESVPAKDSVIALSLSKKGNELTVQYGNEAPVTYTVNLGEYDKENMYVGVYTSRNAYVEFTDISLEVK